jgi:hypothetical protein
MVSGYNAGQVEHEEYARHDSFFGETKKRYYHVADDSE